MHPIVLISGYMVIAVAPLILSAMQGRPPRPLSDEISSGLAMTAFAVLLVEFVMSGRFRLVSARIGMDVTMRFHQLVARVILAFVLIHPFLYQTPLLAQPLPWDTTGQHSLGLDAGSLLTGIIAWIALPGFVLMSIYRDEIPYRYETWRAMHAAGAVVIAVAVTHHTLNAGRYSADPVLSGFWFALLAAAFGSVVWTYIIAPLGEVGRRYQVVSVNKIALKTWELKIRPEQGEALAFEAGQFAWLNIGHSPFSLHENPFSISSAPAERPDIRFVIKEMGDMTRRIGDTTPGTVAYLDGAHGNLTVRDRPAKGIALIAGGVGIAPLLSIARQMQAENDQRPLILLYGNRVAEQIIYKDELDNLASRAETTVVHVVSEPTSDWKGLTGLINRATIKEVFAFEGAAGWLYLVCGPPPMLEPVEEALVALGVPTGQIVSEQFYYD